MLTEKVSDQRGKGRQVFFVESIPVDTLHDKVMLMESTIHTNQSRGGDVVDLCEQAPDSPSH